MKITLEKFNAILISFVIGLVIGVIFDYYAFNKDNNTIFIENNKIDSLKLKRDSIKIIIENIDSIKNAKIIEVSRLDNDSTVKLFYKLVKE